MPYASNSDLPAAVKGALPAAAQSIWRGAYTGFTKSNPDASEDAAYKVAWAAVKKKYKKVKDDWVEMHDASTLHMQDAFVIDGVRRTSDGYLTAYAKIARTGVQVYKGKELGRPELGDVKVYRPPAEVFDRAAMHSMAHRPVTMHHPSETVTSRNWKKYAIGHTGDEVVRDGDFIRVPMVVMDHAAIDAVENGDAKELSVGYSTDLKWEPGRTADGETYDAVQTAIRGNHLAIVPVARGGGKLRLGDDKDEHGYGSFPRGKTVEVPGARNLAHFKGIVTKVLPNKKYEVTHGGPKKFQQTVRTYHEFELQEPKTHDGQPTFWDDSIESCEGREHDPEADRYLRKAANPKVAPSYRKQAAADLMNYLTENYGDEEGKRRYDEMTAGLTFDAVPMYFDKDFSEEERKRASKTGAAMPDGSFPINTTGDLANAVKAVGRAKDYAAAKAHIIKRARALGATGSLPDDWVKSTKDAAVGGTNRGVKKMMTTMLVDGVPIELDDVGAAVIKNKISALEKIIHDAKAKADKESEEKDKDDEEAEKEMKDAKAKIDAKDGEIAMLKKQLADAQAATTPQVLDALVKQRKLVIDASTPFLPKTYVYDGKTDPEIRRDVVATQLGDQAVKMSDEGIEAAWHMAVAQNAKKPAGGGAGRLADAITQHNARSAQSVGDGMDIRDAAMAEQEKYLVNAWRAPARS